MSNNETANVVTGIMTEVWNANDPDAADRFLAPAYRDHTYSGGGADGLKAAIRELGIAMPNQRQTIEDIVADGDRVMLRIRLTANQTGPFRGKAPSGKPIDVRVARWFRLENGRIAEHWALLDTFNLMRQMDA